MTTQQRDYKQQLKDLAHYWASGEINSAEDAYRQQGMNFQLARILRLLDEDNDERSDYAAELIRKVI